MLWETRSSAVNIKRELVEKLPGLETFVGEHEWSVAFSPTSGLLNRTQVRHKKFPPVTAYYRPLPPCTAHYRLIVWTTRVSRRRDSDTLSTGRAHPPVRDKPPALRH